jgi:hypothetical protein
LEKGFEFHHADINFRKARALHLLHQHPFESFYQMVLPLKQGQPGLAVRDNGGHKPSVWIPEVEKAMQEGRWKNTQWHVSNLWKKVS